MESKERQFNGKILNLEEKMAEQSLRMKEVEKGMKETEKIHQDLGLAPKEKPEE